MSALRAVRNGREGDEWLAAEQLAAMMAVSAAVAEGGNLQRTLEQIARTAATLLKAQAAAIILRESESENGLAIAASYGLSEKYADYLNKLRPLEVGKGPSGLSDLAGALDAVARGAVRPVVGELRPLEEAQAAIDTLLAGEAAGRQVLTVSADGR